MLTALALATPLALPQDVVREFVYTSGDFFVASVYGMGDLDGDGLDDVLLAITEFDTSSLTGYHARTVSSARFTDIAGTGFPYVTLDLPFTNGVGDVDGDGFADFAQRTPTDDTAGPNRGAVSVHSGVDASLLHVVHGNQDGDLMGGTDVYDGESLARVGDVDGDGHDDYLAANDGWGANRGKAWLWSGAGGNLIRGHQGSQDHEHFGSGMAGIGDVDGDGVPDYAIGGPTNHGGAQQGGYVRVFSGVDGSLHDEIFGTEALGYFGASVSGLGDVDGDGVPDLAIGAPGQNGAKGRVRVHSGADGSTIRTHAGVYSGEHHGEDVEGLGEVNGDGVPDYAGRGNGYDAMPGPGVDWDDRLVVYDGASGAVIQLLDLEVSGGTLDPVGDVSGDGLADVAFNRTLYAPSCANEAAITCTSLPNSTGNTGKIRVCSQLEPDGWIDLRARDLPSNEFGLFVMGTATNNVPLVDGILCVGGQLTRLVDGQDGVVSSGDGSTVHLAYDLSTVPLANTIAPGETRWFQFWHRDGTGANLTDAAEVTFN